MSRARWTLFAIAALALLPGALSARCASDPANLVGASCDFDVPTDVDAWSEGFVGQIEHDGTFGSNEVGSMAGMVESGKGGLELLIESCVTGIPANTLLNFGIDYLRPPQGGPIDGCTFGVALFDSADCTTGFTNFASGPSLTPTPSWQQADGSFTSGASTQSVLAEIFCFEVQQPPPPPATEGTGFQAHIFFDDFYVGDGILPVHLESFSVE